MPLTPFFAVHILDGVLAWPWLLAGFVTLGLMVVIAALRITEDEVPRIGMVGALLFIASIIHIPIGVGSVHLVLTGVGFIIVGIRILLAIPIILTLQALLLQHGGLMSLGVNSATLGLPMLGMAVAYPALKKLLGLTTTWRRFLIGGMVSCLSVLITLTLHYFILRYGCIEDQDLKHLALFDFVWHLPVVVVETMMGALLFDFLYRVKPELVTGGEKV